MEHPTLAWAQPGIAPALATSVAAAAAAPDAVLAGIARAQVALMRHVIDHLPFGVAVVGPRMQVLLANRAAEHDCNRDETLRIDRLQLVASPSRSSGDLHRAIAAARGGRWSLVQVGTGEQRLMVAVMPLWPGVASPEDPVLLVFGGRRGRTGLTIEFYARSCGLTAAETRVLRALHDGLSPRELARQNQVAVSTIRTQLVSIRAKTGARTLTDLIRQIGTLPPIMPAAA